MTPYESMRLRLRKCAKTLMEMDSERATPLVIRLGELLFRYECLEHDTVPTNSPKYEQFVRDVECLETKMCKKRG